MGTDRHCRIAPGLELGVVCGRDLMIHADAQRFIAKRAGARAIEEIDDSPLVAVSHPTI